MARMYFARILSTVGHPALLAPATVVFLALRQGGSTGNVLAAAGVPAAIAAGAMLFAAYQVHVGRWTHVDASVTRERNQLNIFLAAALLGGAYLVSQTEQPREIAIGLAAAGAIVVAALGLGGLLKLSLHTAFAVFAAALFWPDRAGAGVLLALSLAIGWSRLALKRHTPAEVATGLLIGALAGGVFIDAT